jgi:uncharacterized membrane protein
MSTLYVVLGMFIALLCVAAGSNGLAVVIASGLIGLLFARLVGLQNRITELEHQQQAQSWQRNLAAAAPISTRAPSPPIGAAAQTGKVDDDSLAPTSAPPIFVSREPSIPPLASASTLDLAADIASATDTAPNLQSQKPQSPKPQSQPLPPHIFPPAPAYAPVAEPGTFVLRSSANATAATAQGTYPPRDPSPANGNRSPVESVRFESIEPQLPAWLSGLLSFENWPIKLGMILLLIGLASGFRYLSERGYFNLPMELRLLGVALVSLAALVFGYQKREEKRTFSLVVQGGALGALLLTTYAALQLYGLISQPLAFGLMLGIVATGVILAIAQDAMLLALFATLGGFAAPILASTGKGSHVQLFTYYLILNFGILTIALRKGWRPLNVLGAIGTFGIGLGWGANYYRPEFFASVEPFLIAFFLIYVAITVLYSLRHGEGELVLDGVLVFGVPLAAFGAQAGLLSGQDEKLALSTFAAALLYGGLSYGLRERAEMLSKCFLFLALSFFTISIPLYFDASATSALWAIEGVGVIWLAIRQSRTAPMLLGLALQGFAYLSYMAGFSQMSSEPNFVNARCLGAVLLAISALLCAHLFNRLSHNHQSAQTAHRFHGMSSLAWPFAIFALCWWSFAGVMEIYQSELLDSRLAVLMVFVAATGTLCGLLAKLLNLRALHLGVWAALASLSAFAFGIGLFAPIFAHDRGVAFAAVIVFSLVSLKLAAEVWCESMFKLSHALFLFGLCVLGAMIFTPGSLQAHLGITRDQVGSGTLFALQSLPFSIMFMLLSSGNQLVGFPIQQQFHDEAHGWRQHLNSVWLLGIALMILLGCLQNGNATPMAYFPILNPLELSLLFAIYLIWRHFQRSANADGSLGAMDQLRPLLIAVGFLLITTSTLRGVLHMVDPSLGNLANAFISATGQSALALVWSVAGCGAMLLGHARQRRSTWIAGAALMGVVLVKMLLVDRHNLGELPGIVATLGVGALLAAVGYFAPVPPAENAEQR